MTDRPVVLIILDGWGLRDAEAYNAPKLANTPAFDAGWAAGPRAKLSASGADVGLPQGQMGNSEVGHLNLGAGRRVMQTLPRIDAALAAGEVPGLAAYQALVAQAKAGSGRLHLLGLISPGGVHAHQDQIGQLANLFAAEGLEVLLHAWTDGRDTPPGTAQTYLQQLITAAPNLKVASVCGRYHAMDRDQRWERVERAYGLIAKGEAERARFANPLDEITSQDAGDEFLEPSAAEGYGGIEAGDVLVCANFRADRVRQILAALARDVSGYSGEALGYEVPFAPLAQGKLAGMLGLVPYSEPLNPFVPSLFAPQDLPLTLGEVVSQAGLQQLRLAETEKYPHVTFFFNGGREAPFEGEARYMAPSPKVATYDLQPEMSAAEVSDRLVAAIEAREAALIVVNFANPDMVGHTGDLKAAIQACEAVDLGLGRALAALDKVGGVALVTADHGNCEVMWDEGRDMPHTAHTTNPVPIFLHGGPTGEVALKDGRLADVAPTLLDLLGLDKPAPMDGTSLLVRA